MSGLELRIGNAWTRILVAVVAIPLLIYVFHTGGWLFAALVAIISLGATWELVQILTRLRMRPWVPLLFGSVFLLHALAGAGLFTEVLAERSRGLLFTLLLALIIVALLLSLRETREDAVRRLPGTLFAFLYTGVLPLTLTILYEAVNHYLYQLVEPRHGSHPLPPLGNESFEFVLMIFGSIWLCDTGAYVVGRSFGRRKLAPEISPNKSVEGAIGGLFFSVGTSLLLGLLFVDGLPLIDMIAIGLIVGISGQLGDLVESHFKRAAGIKDSSAIIPGHGGLLDRFDSLLLVAPSVLAYLMLRSFFIDISLT